LHEFLVEGSRKESKGRQRKEKRKKKAKADKNVKNRLFESAPGLHATAHMEGAARRELVSHTRPRETARKK
jgi:hypothetical protein